MKVPIKNVIVFMGGCSCLISIVYHSQGLRKWQLISWANARVGR